MDGLRILPPLVRGETKYILDLLVCEVRIFRNILLFNDHGDVVVQIQWWGEIVPSYIRPQQWYILNKQKKFNIQDTNNHFIRYEVRTTIDLFESYLKSCEVLELAILQQKFKKNLIGSAFLRNLEIITQNTDDKIILPLINYSGDKIGDITIFINFFKKFAQREDCNSDLIPSNNVQTIKKIICEEKNKLIESAKDHVHSDKKKQLQLYKNSKNITSDNQLTKCSQNSKDKKMTENAIRHSKLKANENKKIFTNLSENFSVKGLPEVKKVSQLFEVLCCNEKSQNKQLMFDQERLTISNPNKKNLLTINHNLKNSHNLVGSSQNQSSQTFKEITSEVSDRSESDAKSLLTANSLEYSGDPKTNENVLNYLFGSEMDSEAEEVALSDLRQISPPYDLVSSINSLVLNSYKNPLKIEKEVAISSDDYSVPSKNLKFKLSDPVEKKYFETFFMNKKSQSDFKLVGSLKSSFSLENKELRDQTSVSNTFEKISEIKESHKPELSKIYLCFSKEQNESNNLSRAINNCAQCKCDKKLEKLNSVIESLKRFENSVSQEKCEYNLSNFEQRYLRKDS